MQWIDIAKYEEAYKFDRLIARLQAELIRGGGKFADLRDEVVNLVSSLRINLSQVKVKLPTIERKKHKVRLHKLDDLDMVAYRNRVNNVLQAIIDQNETLKKIRLGTPVTEGDLDDLCSLVLTQEPGLDLHDLLEYFQQAESLDQAIREIIGMDADAVQDRFTQFVQAHPNLASHQIKFLDLLQNHIAKYGSIKTDELYQPPFTSLHSDSLDGLFEQGLADELFEIIGSFQKRSDEP